MNGLATFVIFHGEFIWAQLLEGPVTDWPMANDGDS